MKGHYLIIAAATAMTVSGCGGGGSSSSSSSSTTSTQGYALPTEISAIPADSGNGAAASLSRGLVSHLNALSRAVADLPADSDYNKVATRKYVEERSLEQFDIIEQIMNALAQTHYADAANINAGPYKAMIAWEEEQNGVEMKKLEPWVVESQMSNGVNRAMAWIEEPDEGNPGQMRVIKAEFKIYKAATQNADGSYADYGEWDLNVKFNDTATDFFAASARIVNGVTVLKINEHESHEEMGQPMEFVRKALMNRSGANGYGKVEFTDHNCDMNGCGPVLKSVKYAYTADHVALQAAGDPVVYKDRNSKTEFTHRYGRFYAAAGTDANGKPIAPGDNLEKHKSFGFPVSFDDNGVKRHAYYGAWQGRHQLWSGGPNGGGVAAGTTVTREDHGPNQSNETYKVSAPFKGTLTKRTLVAGSLGDILNIPVETWVNKHYDLRWDAAANGGAGAWMYCSGYMDFPVPPAPPGPPVCKDPFNHQALAMSQFSDFGSLVVSQGDRKHVNIGRWDNVQSMPKDYVYLTADPGINGFAGAGFYEANRDNMGNVTPKAPAVKYSNPADGDNMFVDIGGSIYIEYTASGWVQKKLESFDQQTWTPTFVVGGDSAFTPEMGRDYYINSRGANYVVRKVKTTGTAATDYEVWIELQTAANPVSYASILPAGTSYLRMPWRQEVRYKLETNPAAVDANSESTFLKLVYLTDDPNTQDVNESTVTTILTSGEWGLRAYNDNGTPNDFTDDAPIMADGTRVTVDQYGVPTNPDQRPLEFNWEYPKLGDNWGVQQFLCTPDCSAAANYKLLSDPVQLQPVTLVNGKGDSKTLSLQYDGWMHGLPDLYFELSKNDWNMTQAIIDKVINIPGGSSVTDTNGVGYYVKPLEASMFLKLVMEADIVAAGKTAPVIPQDAEVDLTTGMPTFVEHNMGAIPSPVVVKYSEGNPVTE